MHASLVQDYQTHPTRVSTMHQLHQRLPSNTAGRDFIVGDMHGCYDLFKAELEKVRFDAACDRVFSVGDLADRGPNSMACLRLLREPWFHAVRGNHEQMLLNYDYPSQRPDPLFQSDDLFLKNGGDWVHRLDEAEQTELRYELLPRVDCLPYVISVGDGPDRFHIVHSELMTGDPELSDRFFAKMSIHARQAPDRVLTDADLDADSEETLKPMMDAMVWGRRVFKAAKPGQARAVESPAGRLLVSRQPWHPDLSLVYAGHTPANQLRLHASHFFLDRGAYMRNTNSCLQLVCHQAFHPWLTGLTR